MSKSLQRSMYIRCCICIAASIGIAVNSMGIFFKPIASELALPQASVSLMATLISLGTAFFAPVFSKLSKKYPIGHVMSAGAVLTAVSYVLLSFAVNAMMLYIAGVGIGIGTCCFAALPVTVLLKSWFGEKNGKATGSALAFSGVTGALMNPVFSWLITSVGWHMTFRIIAFLFLCFVTPSCYGLRLREDMQEEVSKQTTSYHLPVLLLVSLFVTVICFQASAALNSHLSSFGIEKGYTLSFSAFMVSCTMISNVLMKLLHGYLADRLDAYISSMIMAGIGMLGIVLLLVAPGYQFAILAGSFCYGSFCSNSTVGVSLVSQAVSKEAYSDVYANIVMVGNLSFALCVSLYGLLHDISGSYQLALFAVFMFALVSFVLCFVYRRKRI